MTTAPANLATTVTYNGSTPPPTAAGSYAVVATVTDPNYTGSASGSLVIAPGTPVLTWPTPAAVPFGTALGSAQLDATASVPGTFTYTPAAGTILGAGANQTLSVTFAPADAADETSASVATTLHGDFTRRRRFPWAT